jgi:hypothetical protein
MSKKATPDIHVHVNVNGMMMQNWTPSKGVVVTITYPTPADTPPPSFTATGTVDPPFAAILGLVVLKSDASQQFTGVGVKDDKGWSIKFCELPVGMPLVLFVFGSDCASIGFTSVEFTCQKVVNA